MSDSSQKSPIWIVYYKAGTDRADPIIIIGIVDSEDEAKMMVNATEAYEQRSSDLIDECPISYISVPRGINLVITDNLVLLQ